MAGPGGQQGGRGRGRGRRGGRGSRAEPATPQRSPSPAPSSSSEDALCFEFLLRIDNEPLSIKRLPDKFAAFVDSAEPAELQLHEAICGSCRWPVEVMFDGQGKMYLHTGWEKFARAHNLAVGCLLTCLYEGDDEMAVKVVDEKACRMHYHTDDSGEDTDN